MTDVQTSSLDQEDDGFGLPGLATFGTLAALLTLWGLAAGPFLSPMALFLPVVVPVGIWIAWNDMAFMKIPNAAVVTMVLAFAILGLFAFPLVDYLWRWSHLVVLLVFGILANGLRLMGAGDAKFIAAAAPLVAVVDMGGAMRLFAAALLAAYLTHRLVRRIPALRNRVDTWESWTRRDFPLGFALGGALILYVGLKAYLGA